LSRILCLGDSLFALESGLKDGVELIEGALDGEAMRRQRPVSSLETANPSLSFEVSLEWKEPPLLRRRISSWPLTPSTTWVMESEQRMASG
jgi:hypothetical protein